MRRGRSGACRPGLLCPAANASFRSEADGRRPGAGCEMRGRRRATGRGRAHGGPAMGRLGRSRGEAIGMGKETGEEGCDWSTLIADVPFLPLDRTVRGAFCA